MFRKIIGNAFILIGGCLLFTGGLITGDLDHWPTEKEGDAYARDMRWRWLSHR